MREVLSFNQSFMFLLIFNQLYINTWYFKVQIMMLVKKWKCLQGIQKRVIGLVLQ